MKLASGWSVSALFLLLITALPGCNAAADDSQPDAAANAERETESSSGAASMRIEVTADTQVVAVPDP